MTREQKMQALINVLGFDEAMKLAPGLVDDTPGNTADDTAAEAAWEAAEEAKAASTNPFVRGKNFSLDRQGQLYRNPKTRMLAISLAKSAGILLKDDPSQRDLHARIYEH